MTALNKVKSHPDVIEYFKELSFYNKRIEKPKIKRLKNIDLLSELPFYEELNVIKTNHAFRGYAMSYKVEIIEKKDPIKQLEASKSSIKDLFSDLLNETKGFKYQITLKVMLKKYKPNGEIEFRPVYFNSTTKTVINHKFSLENAFQEILYRIDNWINEGSGWIVELIESQYINISTYRPLSGSSYIKLPAKLRCSKEGLINIKKKKDQKWFLWCHVRHIQKELQGKVKNLLMILIMMELNFLCEKKIFKRLRKRTIFALTFFVMKISWFSRFIFQIKTLKI